MPVSTNTWDCGTEENKKSIQLYCVLVLTDTEIESGWLMQKGKLSPV